MITAKSDLYLLIGNPVSHSLSPIFQNECFSHYKINAVYIAINIEKDDFDLVIKAMKKLNIKGINVTIPYKIDILKYLDDIKNEAAKINSVNTIEIIDKKWIGHNTDWYGVLKTLENKKVNKKNNTLIIGAGGATNGVIYGLQQYGINNITITNRSIEKAKDIAKKFNIDLLEFENYLNSIDKFDFIINTTSIEFENLINEVNETCIYFDLKYYSKGLNTKNFIDGKDMLLYQGAKAFEIWTKISPDIKILRESLNKINE
ncbi:MAG TPA: shikimate dehydrogenase [Spirochaetota bacterium]|nr:shikimate dehydrogenase [Spirochaetota bacterium]HOL56781.1 shikimate dehydrogenase [Spirochaetota bacterium]HPP04248.1 shikimate dehydrogenase [Spirochaetota bacterium]